MSALSASTIISAGTKGQDGHLPRGIYKTSIPLYNAVNSSGTKGYGNGIVPNAKLALSTKKIEGGEKSNLENSGGIAEE